MSEAKVTFQTISGAPCQPGEKPQRFSFRCVNGNRGRNLPLGMVECEGLLIAGTTDIKRDGQGQNGGRPQWDWDGNPEAPTFSPSINCEKHCGWHGYIKKGRCLAVNGTDEPE